MYVCTYWTCGNVANQVLTTNSVKLGPYLPSPSDLHTLVPLNLYTHTYICGFALSMFYLLRLCLRGCLVCGW